MTLAIEPMVNLGRAEVETLPDRWTVRTRDGKPSAHFEHTVAVGADGPEILTRTGSREPGRRRRRKRRDDRAGRDGDGRDK